MRIPIACRATLPFLALALAGCGSDFALPTEGDPFDTAPGDAAVLVGDVGAAVVDQMCTTVDFNTGFAHGDELNLFNVPLNGGFNVTVNTVSGGSQSANQARIFNSAGVVPLEDIDLLNDPTGTCLNCDGNIVVISDTDFTNRGDSPDGGVITLTGFPGVGETTIKSYAAIDQQNQDGLEEHIYLEIDGVETGQSSMLGESSVEKVNATETPIETQAAFLFVGSGAIDDIEICYTPPPPPPPGNPGTGTIGYWRNHPDAWPVASITVGGVVYTKAAAIDWMDTPGRGDKSIDLFKQLVAAKLNVLIGNDFSCVQDEIDDADTWLGTNPLGSNVRANSSAWRNEGGDLHGHLTSYNEGDLCAPHRDD